MPHHQIILRWNGPNNCPVARSFQDAAIAFLSKPFLLDKQIWNSDDKQYSQDFSVVRSIHLNSSIWVIGPFIPTLDSNSITKYTTALQLALPTVLHMVDHSSTTEDLSSRMITIFHPLHGI